MAVKYVFVTGGVVSGLGKGITAASLGRLLKARGYTVTMQKFDPYINIDPGTMNPVQHGEVFVTDDGAETDLDLGHYERFIDESLTKNSNVTTGKIYWSVLQKERRGDFGGGTVQVIPHITNEIKSRFYRNPSAENTEIAIIEVGGTVGDIESQPFLESIRQFQHEKGRDNVILIHVTLIPYLRASQEMKTKPTQASVKELQGMGIQPDIIVPEVEAIATSELAAAAERGAQVVPSAEIASICMDRERLRVLAHEELGLPTTPYRFAGSLEELRAGAKTVGYPCVVKPIMSSSGHGQSVVRSADAIDAAWVEAQEGRRAHDEGDVSRVIVEALAPLDYELTVLTVSSSAGIVTCAPIGQRQESGDYRESWQPASFTQDVLMQAQRIACTAVEGLVAKAKASGEKGWGVFGVELFVLTDGSVLFNEVSPRPHDTGMVTMASQRLSEFALHARAILGLPITQEHVALSIPDGAVAASHAIVIQGDGEAEFRNVATALSQPGTDLRIFAKPEVHGHRRMAVALAIGTDEADARAKAENVAESLEIDIA